MHLNLWTLFPSFAPILCAIAASLSLATPGPVYGQDTANHQDTTPLSAEADEESSPTREAETLAEEDATEDAASQQTQPSQAKAEPSGFEFRFLGDTYHIDGSAEAAYLYRFDHERVPTAEATPRILDQKFITHVLHFDLAFAVTNRPWADGQFSVGLRSQQDWHANHSDTTAYLNDVTDIDAFPFRTRLLESDHRLFGWYRHQLTDSAFVNLYGAYRVRHEGALRLSVQERRSKGDNAPRLRSIKWLPSVQIATEHYGTFLPYLYFVRQQNYVDTTRSFETYSLSETPKLSFGLRHVIDVWQGVRLLSEAYRHSYTFNAFTHDYDRLGLVARVDGKLPATPLGAGGVLGYSQDDFNFSQMVVNGCSFPDGSASTPTTVACNRQDSNLYLGFWANYIASPNHVWSFRYSNIESQSNLGRHNSYGEFQYILGYKYNFDRFHGSQSFTDTQLDRIYGKKAFTYD